MPKLTTRQIIILGVMILAVLYGAYDFFYAGRKKAAAVDPAKKASDLNVFISDMAVALSKDTPSPVDAHMIKRAEAGWAKDPFYDRKTDREWAAVKEPAPAGGAIPPGTAKRQFNYTGYVDAGRNKIAVVNGNEYGVGDALDVEGYILKGIYPTRVTVYNRETRRSFDIPLED